MGITIIDNGGSTSSSSQTQTQTVFSGTLNTLDAWSFQGFDNVQAIRDAGFTRLKITIGSGVSSSTVSRDWVSSEQNLDDMIATGFSITQRLLVFVSSSNGAIVLRLDTESGGAINRTGVYTTGNAIVRIEAVR